MNLHPFGEVAANAENKVKGGWMIFQQFQCGGCGVKQTIDKPNSFYIEGICEECGHVTDIQKDGCNFMAVTRAKGKEEIGERLKEVVGG